MENIDGSVLNELNLRLEKYLSVQKAADGEGNASKVRRYKRIVGQYELAIKQIQCGQPAALNELPNPPGFPDLVPRSTMLDTDTTVMNPSPAPSPLPSPQLDRRVTGDCQPTVTIEEAPDSEEFNINEELVKRLHKYETVLQAAESEGTGAKIRRYKRIISQYNEAIAAANAGKTIDLAELPNPPGFPPLVPTSSPLPSPQPSPLPVRARQPSPSPGKSSLDDNPKPMRPAPSAPIPTKPVVTRAEKQTALLKQRQQEYKEAALSAKRGGQITEAKEYLKMYKGFDRLIQASESGLPVDLTSIPVSLKAKSDCESTFYVVSENDFKDGSENDVFLMLKNELSEQIKSCLTRRNHFRATGDVANANRFEQWALTFKKDLNKITMLQNSAQPIPKFHFEQKSFPVMECFTDVAPGDVELTIVQAVNLPKTVDSYVSYEFPYPTESPPTGYSSVIKDSSDPTYNSVIKFAIDRESKPCQRLFKRHGIKLEVWAKGGFFHRDFSLGTVTVKLAPLLTDIMIHDAFDLMNGRRPCGGKLEVKVRVRDPIVTKKIQTINEKWLILD